MQKLIIVKYLLDQISFYRYDLQSMIGAHVKTYFDSFNALWDEVYNAIDKYESKR